MKKRTTLYQIVMLFLALIILLFLMGFMFIPLRIVRWVPYNLHSLLSADYSADELSGQVPQINLGLIIDALRDRGTPVALEWMATIQTDLQTPVPSVTPPDVLYGSPTPWQASTPLPTNIQDPRTPTVISTLLVTLTPSQVSPSPTFSPNSTVIIDPSPTLQFTPYSTVPNATISPRVTPTRTIQPSATRLIITTFPSATQTLNPTIRPATRTPTAGVNPTRTAQPTMTPTSPHISTRTPTPSQTATLPPPPTRTPTAPPPPTRTPEPYPPPYP